MYCLLLPRYEMKETKQIPPSKSLHFSKSFNSYSVCANDTGKGKGKAKRKRWTKARSISTGFAETAAFEVVTKTESNYSRYGLLLLLLLLSRFSRVRLCVTPRTAAHQASPSMGFSRQEYWSGLPFPSPMHESEVTQSCPTLSDPTDCSLPGSSVHGIFQARVLEWVAIAFSEVWSGQGIKTRCLLVKCTVPHAPWRVSPVL